MPEPQSFKNHTRTDPTYHLVVLPVLGLNFFAAIYYTIHRWPDHRPLHLWSIVVSFVLFLAAAKARSFSLRVQDRIIRLEERLRLMALLPDANQPIIRSLTERQLIALRFASDVELPTLAQRAVNENLDGKQIKALITTWRADNFRV